MTKIKLWQCRFEVGKNSSQQVLKVQPQTEVTKSNHLHIRTKTKCNMCKLSLVVEMQKKKKKGEQVYRKKNVSRQLTICSLGYWRSRTSPVLVHDGTFSLSDTLKKTAEYKCHITARHQTTNSNTTALTQNAYKPFWLNIHVTFTWPTHVKSNCRNEVLDRSSVLYPFFFSQNDNSFVTLYLQLQNLISRQRPYFFLLLRTLLLFGTETQTECDCNWIQLSS